jgi:hypothetical protein
MTAIKKKSNNILMEYLYAAVLLIPVSGFKDNTYGKFKHSMTNRIAHCRLREVKKILM